MDQDLHRLLYRNAELETELRLIKEQLTQAHQANTYLLGRMSVAQVPYQTSRYLPTPHFVYDTSSTEPHRELTDLLSFDDAHDSGYYNSPKLAPSVASTANRPPVTRHEHESRGQAAAKEEVVKRRVPERFEQSLIDHGDSFTSPSETPPPQPDFKFLRNRPIKHSVGLGILNARKYSSRGRSTPDDGDAHAEAEDQEGFTITRADGSKFWVPTGDGPPARTTPKVNHDEPIPTQEQEEPQPEIPQIPQTAPTGPANNPYRNPYPRQNNLVASRWSPYTDPNNLQRQDPNSNYQRRSPYNGFQRLGPQSVLELFSLPSSPEQRDLYRTVLITNIPTSTEIAKILAPVQGNLAGINITKTAGMKTVPPMETNAAMLTFENCVAATRFLGNCSEEKPYEFEADFNLMRTVVSGGANRQKWEGHADRRAPQPPPPWSQFHAQGGLGGQGQGPMMRMELETGGGLDEAEREGEAMMREG